MKPYVKESFVLNNSEYKVKPINSPFGEQFNIDKQCQGELQKNLGWKCWWRENQSKWLIPKDTYFNDTPFTNYIKNTPLKYDGVFKL